MAVSTQPFTDFMKDQAPEEDLSWLKFEGVDDLPTEEPEIVINGLLRIGEKLGITAGSKSFKTWVLLYIAFCIANGLEIFPGHKANKMKIVMFDLELSRFSIRRRLYRIKKAVGKGDFTNLKVCGLRGKARLFCRNLERVKTGIATEGFKVVIIDPVYKFLLGKNESDNGMVADMLENLTEFCMAAEIALIYVHHHSKGNQSEKDSLDRGSGAGAWSRDPDTVVDITKHTAWTKEEPVYTCSITVRDFEPINDFVLRWEYPLLIKDDRGLDPGDLKKNQGGRPKQDNSEVIMAVFRAFEMEGGATAQQVSDAALINKRTIQRRIKDLMPARLVKSTLNNGYQLSLSESNKLQEFKHGNNGTAEGSDE